MSALGPPKRSAPGREITGAAKLRLMQLYQQCSHSATITQRTPPGHAHYAQVKCASCGPHLRWLPKPEIVEKRRLKAFLLARLAVCDRLTSWKRHFIRDVSQHHKVSPRQQEIIDRLSATHLEAAK